MRTAVWLSYSYPIQSTKANYYIPYATRSRYEATNQRADRNGLLERRWRAVRVADQPRSTMSTQHSQKLSVNGTSLAETDESGLNETDIFDLMSNSRRLHALRVLFEHERIDFGELVDRVAELEYGHHIDDISSDERHKTYVSLQQSHIGRLEKFGVVEYERDTGTITLGPNADVIAPWVAKAEGSDSLSSKLNRALSALC